MPALALRYRDNACEMANSLRQRMGYKKAVVALARKLSGLMLSMWKSGEFYHDDQGKLAA